jgi:HEAT repeat protein
MTKLPSDDEAALARQHTLEAIEVLEQILRDQNALDEVRRAAEQVLIERGFVRLPEGPMRPCRVH